MKKLKSIIPGIAVCAVMAAVATLAGGINIGGFSFDLIGAPVIAILLGMILTLIFPKLAGLSALSGGIKFTSKKILQWAVVILGFSLNLSTIAKVGAKSLPVIIGTISISLIVAFIMMKIMKVDPKTACLIGVGSSICGGSAIAATAPVIEADDEDVARSISVIFLFNVLAALIFPTLGHAIGLGTEGFAVFVDKEDISVVYTVLYRRIAYHNSVRTVTRKQCNAVLFIAVCAVCKVACEILYSNGYGRYRAEHQYCKACKKRRQTDTSRALLLGRDHGGFARHTEHHGDLRK